MRERLSTVLVVVFLLVVVVFGLILPIHSSDLQPVGGGKRGLLDQNEPLQAYSFSEPPEAEWNKTYGGANDDYAGCVIQTCDGGYALAGETESFGASGSDFWLVKTDSAGNVQWNKTYGGAYDDSACSVVQTSDGGYALFGTTKSFGDTTGDFWLVKVDQFGNEEWNKTYSKAPRWDKARSMAYTSDGGFILAGDAEWTDSPWSQAWLVKTNSSGDVEWSKTYGQNVGLISTYATSVIECSDGGYAVAGRRYPNPTYRDVWLFKTASNGTMLWHKNYGKANYHDEGQCLVETSDGGFAIVGGTQSFDAGGDDFWLIKTDADGNHLWNRTYGGANNDYANSVIQTGDGGYALAGYTYSFGVSGRDAWLVRTDACGNHLWNRTYGGANDDAAICVIQTGDGGYALAGYTYSFGVSGRDAWLIKLAPDEVVVDWWPMFHHDLSHTGYSTSSAPSTNTTSWSYTTGGPVGRSPAVDDGKVYVGSIDGKVYCLDASTGAFIWSYTTGSSVFSSPAVDDGKIYVGSDDDKVYCLDASTGAFIWSYTTGDYVWSSPAVAGGRVFVGSNDWKIYCLDASTGAHIWNYTTGDYVASSPAVDDGKVYVGSDDDKVYCLDASTGAFIWSYTTGDYVRSSPAVADGKVYVGSFDNKVYCLDASTGTHVWNYTTGAIVFSSPAVADGKVYVGSLDNKTYCLNAATGAFIWSYTTEGLVFSSPAVACGKVCVGSDDFKVYCLNALTGAPIWSYTTGGPVPSSPAVADGKVFIGSFDGKVYAFGPPPPPTIWPMFHHDLSHTGYSTSTAPNTNTISWRYTTGGGWSSPAVADGKVYVGSWDDKVYCLNATTGKKIWSYTTGDNVKSSPAVACGKVYVGSDDDKLHCLDASTGASIWNYTIPFVMWHSSPAVADCKVFVGSGDDKVYCLDASTGASIWNYTTGSGVFSSPAVADGKVYVGSFDDKVYCLDASTGASIWNYTTGSVVISSPAVADGKVFVGSFDNKTYCLDATTGAHIWNYTTGSGVWPSPAVAYGKVFVGSEDNKVYCLDASTGASIWNYTTGGRVRSSPAVADGKVFVGSEDNKVYCLDASTGAFIWSYTTGSDVLSSPAVADGKVFVGSEDGKVYAFGPTYVVTIQAYCHTEDTPVSVSITMDGSPTGYNTSHTFTGLTGTPKFTVPSNDPNGHPFKQWNTGETNTTITISSDGTYTAHYSVPDVAVTNVTPSRTAVGEGCCMNITVTVENQGNFSETFRVFAYYTDVTMPPPGQWETFWSMGDVNRDGYIDSVDNATLYEAYLGDYNPDCDFDSDGDVDIWDVWIFRYNYGSDIWTHFGLGTPPIGRRAPRVVGLPPGNQITLTITWNTTGVAKGNYTLSANATIAPGETDTADNIYPNGWVLITCKGDFGSGLPPEWWAFDGQCDYQDLSLFRQAYLYSPQPPLPAPYYLADLGSGLPPAWGAFDDQCDYQDLSLFREAYLA